MCNHRCSRSANEEVGKGNELTTLCYRIVNDLAAALDPEQ
jgi:hypothetical protein